MDHLRPDAKITLTEKERKLFSTLLDVCAHVTVLCWCCMMPRPIPYNAEDFSTPCLRRDVFLRGSLFRGVIFRVSRDVCACRIWYYWSWTFLDATQEGRARSFDVANSLRESGISIIHPQGEFVCHPLVHNSRKWYPVLTYYGNSVCTLFSFCIFHTRFHPISKCIGYYYLLISLYFVVRWCSTRRWVRPWESPGDGCGTSWLVKSGISIRGSLRRWTRWTSTLRSTTAWEAISRSNFATTYLRR